MSRDFLVLRSETLLKNRREAGNRSTPPINLIVIVAKSYLSSCDDRSPGKLSGRALTQGPEPRLYPFSGTIKMIATVIF
jgi:hypothetical protein